MCSATIMTGPLSWVAKLSWKIQHRVTKICINIISIINRIIFVLYAVEVSDLTDVIWALLTSVKFVAYQALSVALDIPGTIDGWSKTKGPRLWPHAVQWYWLSQKPGPQSYFYTTWNFTKTFLNHNILVIWYTQTVYSSVTHTGYK